MNDNILPSPDAPEFPAALAAARQQRHISAAELARRAGISSTMVARYENTSRADHHRPRPQTVALLEAALRGETVTGTSVGPSSITMPTLTSVPLEDLIKELERRGYGVTLQRPAPRDRSANA